tara:strand:- start:255 stop:497 length:243 start_codon:yes stop_codon:yes gene_type:complete
MVIPVHEMIDMIEEATTELKKTHEAVKDATAMALELRKDFDDLAECVYARLMNHNPLTGKDHADLKDLVIRLRKKWELSE